jgi:eukaryotic-like serine/threonine-protein kinase
LWADTFVDFEHGLNTAVKKLRQVLGDNPENPIFIETVPRSGYRFIASVRAIETNQGGLGLPATEGSPATPVAVTTIGNRRWAWPAMAVSAGLMLLSIGYWYPSRPLPLPRIVAFTQITHDGRSKNLAGTDGSRLYFTQSSPNMIAQVGVNGGEIAQLPVSIPETGALLMDISPDGSSALIGAVEQGHLVGRQWVVPVLGGAAKRLEDGEDLREKVGIPQGSVIAYKSEGQAFSPDGGSIIYSTASGDVNTVRTDGTAKHKIASVGSVAVGFRWSPDGRVIRFDKASDIWEMSADGTGIHQLLPDWKKELPRCCGRWTTDGRFYIFLTGDRQLWAIDERHSLFRRRPALPIQLTYGPIHWGHPIPGKEGNKIFVEGATPRGELSRIDPKTSIPQPFLDGISAEFVSFSPDGNSVAYVTFPESVLWRADRKGAGRIQLTQSPNLIANPRWSPDSKQILFETRTPDKHDLIRRVSAADGSRQWLMSEETSDKHDANWSPDGRKVLFAMGPGGDLERGKRDLRIVDLETRQVTIIPESDGMWSPRWSPDGRYVVAMFQGKAGLFLFDLNSQKWRTLPVGGDVEFPNFSSDSRFIYFLRMWGVIGVYRIPVTGGKLERVVDMTNWHLTGVVGGSMSLDPTDAPLVLRDTGSDDIYALTLEEK